MLIRCHEGTKNKTEKLSILLAIMCELTIGESLRDTKRDLRRKHLHSGDNI
jgi:hypothetical protein